MRCDRCGWEWDPEKLQEIPEITGWPDDVEHPPLPPLHPPHPVDRCPSPYAKGDMLWWDMGGRAPDLPPILATFTKLAAFTGPEFRLEDGQWISLNDGGAPCEALIILEPPSVTQDHVPYLEDFLNSEETALLVHLRDCTPVARWPVLICGEPR